MEKLGIDNLWEMTKFGLNLGETIESAVVHGPMKPETVAKLWNTINDAPDAFKDMEKIVPEAMDIDDQEKAELVSKAKAEFDLENDKAEAYVERGIELSLCVVSILQLMKKKPA